MSNRTLNLTDTLYHYVLNYGVREHPLLESLRKETAADSMSRMQIAPEQGQFLGFLVHLIRARKALEIGTYTGYSSLCIAHALPAEGQLIACDVSKEWTAIAQKYWQLAGVNSKIQLYLQPAVRTLDALIQQDQDNTFDFIFIDADKTNYDTYYEKSLCLIRSGGLIVIDNVLWGGAVSDPTNHDADTIAIRALNEKIVADSRVEMSLIPVADGLMLVTKH